MFFMSNYGSYAVGAIAALAGQVLLDPLQMNCVFSSRHVKQTPGCATP
jgi:hypothetical protein